MAIPKETKDKIAEELNKRIKQKDASLKCPICTHNDFTLIDGYSRRILNEDIKKVNLVGLNVPSITIACNNCGYLMDFSLGALGFLKEKPKTQEEHEGGESV